MSLLFRKLAEVCRLVGVLSRLAAYRDKYHCDWSILRTGVRDWSMVEIGVFDWSMVRTGVCRVEVTSHSPEGGVAAE